MTDLRARLGREVLILDGSMGAFLQSKGLPAGMAPDLWNLERRDVVCAAHRLYVEAGARILLTNTFGATAPRLEAHGAGSRVAEVCRAAVDHARTAAGDGPDAPWVAGDVGPLGLTVEPAGELPFSAAVRHFREQMGAMVDAGVDLLVIETLIDIVEMRAAVIAANEVRGDLPLIASMSFGPDGVTDTGVTPAAAAVILEGLGVDAVGVNCSTGPEAMLEVVRQLVSATALPVAVQPNAGLPLVRDGQQAFPMDPAQMEPWYGRFVEAGAALVGGCCGTTPDTIRLAAASVGGRPVSPPAVARDGALRLASRSSVVSVGPGAPLCVVGERINPTGKPKFAEALRQGQMDRVLGAARRQAELGASALDVNVGVPGIDEAATLARVVAAVQNVVDLPLVLDSADPAALARGLEVYAGRALVNSVNAKERTDEMLTLIRRHGAAVLLLPTGETIPEDLDGRMTLARDLVERALAAGLRREDLVLDVLALAVSAMQEGARSALDAARAYRDELGVPSICGLSNISFGLPRRKLVNRSFLTMAMGAGLDAAIADPLDGELMAAVSAAGLFAGRDPGSRRFLAFHRAAGDEPPAPVGKGGPRAPVEERLSQAVIDGDRMGAEALTKEAVAGGAEALPLLLETLTPAIQTLGALFAERKRFIPHLVSGAEAMQRAVAVIEPQLAAAGRASRGTVVFGTVSGDVHDIGKNICVLMLRSFGFQVVDLGRSVPTDRFVEAAREHDADLVAMSALMTTTMERMGEVIAALDTADHPAKTLVGGAVITRRAAREMGADGYARDAGSIVGVAEELLGVVPEE